MSAPLEQERKFFDEHQEEWQKLHPGKFVLVKGEALIGVFDSDTAAVEEGIKRFCVQSFLVRPVSYKEQMIRIPALMFGLIHANPPLPA